MTAGDLARPATVAAKIRRTDSSMNVTLDNPPAVAAPFGDRFAHVARLQFDGGTLLMLAGQVAVDDAGRVVAPGDAAAQAARIFEIIGGILAAHGATFADVVHIRTFMTDLDDLPAYGAVRGSLFTPPRIPRRCGRRSWTWPHGSTAIPCRGRARAHRCLTATRCAMRCSARCTPTPTSRSSARW